MAALSVHSAGRGTITSTPRVVAELRHALAQPAVGGDAAGDDEALDAGGVERLGRGVDQHVDQRLLHAGRDVGELRRASGGWSRTYCHTAVLKPLKLRSKRPRFRRARGKRMAVGLPVRARRSIAGPPG